MANDCSNNIVFLGDEKQIELIIKAYEKTLEIRKNNPKCNFVLFEPGTPILKYFSDLDVNEADETIYFITPWAPDPVQVIRAAKMFGVSFIYSYEELGDSLYGEFHYDYDTDTLKDRCLTPDEIDENKRCGNLQHDSDLCNPQECEDYENDFEQMDTVLEKKEWDFYTFDLSTGQYSEE